MGISYGVTPLTTSTQTGLPIRFFPDGSCDDVRVTLRLGDASSTVFYAVRVYGPTGQSRVLSNVDPTTGSLVAITPATAPTPGPPAVTPPGSRGERAGGCNQGPPPRHSPKGFSPWGGGAQR